MDIHFCMPSEAPFRTVISVIAKFGASIKCLRFNNNTMSMSEFLEILSLIPNVQHLIFNYIRLRAEDMPLKRKRSTNRDLNLYQLKKLRFWCGCHTDAFLAVFDRLPVGALAELELTTFRLNTVAVLIKRQTNITKLIMTIYELDSKATVPDDIFDNLQLESLKMSYSSCDNFNIAALLSKQTQLKSLSMPYVNTEEDVLNVVANQFTELKALSINISKAPSARCIANISKLKRLKYWSLSLKNTSTNQLDSLARYPNVGITSLSLDHDFLQVDLVPALAKTLTKLKVLKFYGRDNCTTLVNAILRNFNFVEVLHIRGDIDTYYQLNDGDCFNPKLTELIFPLPRSATSLNKLIADYPNVRKFQIDWDSIESWEFRRILNGFTQLKSLTFIGSAGELTIDDLNCLKDYRNNLKFISFGGIQVRLTDDLKRHLSASFGVVIYDNYRLNMAIDRHTMNRERQSKEDLDSF